MHVKDKPFLGPVVTAANPFEGGEVLTVTLAKTTQENKGGREQDSGDGMTAESPPHSHRTLTLSRLHLGQLC